MDGSDTVKGIVRAAISEWAKYANLIFRETETTDAELRISFREPGSWSVIGTDALAIPKDQPTINYGTLESIQNDPAMATQTALHEFGHVLGLQHEYQNPDAGKGTDTRHDGACPKIQKPASMQVSWQNTRRNMLNVATMRGIGGAFALFACTPLMAADRIPWPSTLPVYDHIVIVIEENKDVEQIFGSQFDAPYIRQLAAEGAVIDAMFGEEHHSQGNYFWLFSGSNQNVGFLNQVPSAANHPNYPFTTSNLGEQLIKKGLSFKGYSESLPAIGSQVDFDPPNYARKHVPWISFGNVPNGTTIETSSNLRFADFPMGDYSKLPTVAVVVANLIHDMHHGRPEQSIPAGDAWLRDNLDGYYQWAKTHNSLLIVTFDENDDKVDYQGLTNPMVDPGGASRPSDLFKEYLFVLQNRVVTIFAGAHVRPGKYSEGKGMTHVNVLRTIEAMYGLPKSGAQQPNAAGGGISDDMIVTDIFAEQTSIEPGSGK